MYVADKQNKETLTPGGEKTSGLSCFLQILLLQFPGLIGRGRRCCSKRLS